MSGKEKKTISSFFFSHVSFLISSSLHAPARSFLTATLCMLFARQSEFLREKKKKGKRRESLPTIPSSRRRRSLRSLKPPPPPKHTHKKPLSLGQASDVIPKLLGARARVLTTRCVLNELKMMGPEFRAAAIDARKGAALHYCGHGGSDGDVNDRRRRQQEPPPGAAPAPNEPCLPAAACLASCVGPAGNAEHFVVATQDRALRAALGEAPAGAAIFLTASGPQFEPPTEAQRRFCAAAGAADRGALPGERAPVAGCGGEALEEVARAARRAWAKDTAVAFRRNRAKGPNPLSVKKKKDKATAATKSSKEATKEPAEEKKKNKSEKKPEEETRREQRGGKEGEKKRVRPRRRKREGGETAAAVAASS